MNVSFWVGTFWTSSWPERNNMSGFGYTDTLLIRIHVFLVLVFFWDLLTIWRISPDISLREMLLRPSVDIINVEETVLTSPVSLSVHRGSSPSCAGSRERCRGWPAAAGTVWSPRWSPRCPQLHTHTHRHTEKTITCSCQSSTSVDHLPLQTDPQAWCCLCGYRFITGTGKVKFREIFQVTKVK